MWHYICNASIRESLSRKLIIRKFRLNLALLHKHVHSATSVFKKSTVGRWKLVNHTPTLNSSERVEINHVLSEERS